MFWDNDGLWYQGDAPRHAMNGLFWKDFLLSGSFDPRAYALSYYARYPAISPTLYPPGFYFLEALAFGLFGPSPYVAKGLVLSFALMSGLYTMAWLRRWLAPVAGGAAALLLLLPGLTTWAHAVMLNVPSLAIGLAALYHMRRALELPEGPRHARHLYAAAALATLGILIYPMTGLVLLVGLAWLAAMGRWKLLALPRTLLVAVACAALLLPLAYIIYRWAPWQMRQATLQVHKFSNPRYWTFYPARLTELVDAHLLILSGMGLIIGLAQRHWRRETYLALLWIGVCYVVLSSIWAKDSRYLLLVLPAVVYFAALALLSVSEWVAGVLPAVSRRMPFLLSLGVLLLVEVQLARGRTIPTVASFQEVAGFVAHVAPAGAVFYDGRHNGVFSFHVRAVDPEYRRQVLRSDRLFHTASDRELDADEYEAILAGCGCRWLVIESGDFSERTAEGRSLRQALGRSTFKHVRSFPIAGAGPGAQRVDIYTVLEPTQPFEEVPLTIDVPGAPGPETVEPIRRRESR